MIVDLPYGDHKLSLKIPDHQPCTILQGKLESYVPEQGEDALVQSAMDHPVGSQRLSELAKGKKRVVLICSDHTRPVPSKLIVPKMLKEIREGNPDAEITLLIATGCHRSTNKEELRAKFGDEIFEHEKIVIHDCEKEEELTHIGTLPSGGDLVIS